MPPVQRIKPNYTPNEGIIVHQPLGLTELGSSFNAEAPFRACRLCGFVYQSPLDLLQYDIFIDNDGFPLMDMQTGAIDRDALRKYLEVERDAEVQRDRWQRIHDRRYHSSRKDQLAIAYLHEYGIAFMPEAAHRLTSYGIFPVGNKTSEIVHAMATAPRAPENDPDANITS